MSNWAQVDKDNIVVRVLVGDNNDPNGDEGFKTITEIFGGTWVKTSYNATIRKNFAGIGYTYNELLDAFIPPKPYESWILDEETCSWKSLIEYPVDGNNYFWDEDSESWTLIQ